MSMPALLRPAFAADASASLVSLTDLVPRIRTGCVFEEQPEDTRGVLVTREVPRRLRWMRATFQAHWRWCAPSRFLLTGHTTRCHHRHCHPNKGQTEKTVAHSCDVPASQQRMGWEAFAAAYRAELDCWSHLAHIAAIHQIARWLQTFETVTLLSFEPSMPRGAALAAWRERGEFIPYAQRHILRDWLLTGPLR
jgi:uncharacterized protein YeaO (DUF488 family)